MTSCEPLAELALRALADAPPGIHVESNPTAQHDLKFARRLSAAERIAALNEILLLAEAFGLPPPSREPIEYHDIRL